MAGVAVEIRSSCHEKTMSARDRSVMRLRSGIVIAVARFDRVEARVRESGDEMIAPRHAGMRERGKAARIVNDLHDVVGGRADPRHVRRTIGLEISREGLIRRTHVSRPDERLRDLRTPDAAAAPCIGKHGLGVNSTAERGEALGHHGHTAHAIGLLPLEQRA